MKLKLLMARERGEGWGSSRFTFGFTSSNQGSKLVLDHRSCPLPHILSILLPKDLTPVNLSPAHGQHPCEDGLSPVPSPIHPPLCFKPYLPPQSSRYPTIQMTLETFKSKPFSLLLQQFPTDFKTKPGAAWPIPSMQQSLNKYKNLF